ncbi:peptidyl-prolyl cis-trans isomerase B (cyclophilin B) [Lentzea xinjiangensis]|uniref:Peptidyl-prolyl cis-trans isomerase n=1 Tax=Lentzea xinjiangensis TaxID=402600 RepID=A0A1H9GBI2_9PSEU|nr:peptidylprolyl isomerase [Lentzea xinjiangensis]SEQ47420.1 peptidyl-prolyl cis-trans isomerase B (cyclophilin B) [Lentzea xinjiangensis]
MRRIAASLAVAALAAGVITTGTASAQPQAQSARPDCGYTATPDDPAARPVTIPRDPWFTKGKVLVKVKTNQGDVPLVLDRGKAPCTTHSFIHLAHRGFYHQTECHRLTAYPTLKVLQCGDPSGTGAGGPGYKYADELPTDLPPAPNDPTGQRRVYPRGTLAMANAGPDTNGSQFFLVQSDSILRPNYTVFGQILPEGLKTLDKIAAGGIAGENPQDGRPASTTELKWVLPLGV